MTPRRLAVILYQYIPSNSAAPLRKPKYFNAHSYKIKKSHANFDLSTAVQCAFDKLPFWTKEYGLGQIRSHFKYPDACSSIVCSIIQHHRRCHWKFLLSLKMTRR